MTFSFDVEVNEILGKINKAGTINDLESVKVYALGKNGVITNLLSKLKEIEPCDKKIYGIEVNKAKQIIINALSEKQLQIEEDIINNEINSDKLDLSLPTYQSNSGKLHPVYHVIEEIEDIFFSMGFHIADGNEIEDVYYNFTAANMPDHHPARQMHDTFYIKDHKEKVLRTHTTPMQIHEMIKIGAPLRVIVPGRVFRSDYDATHTPVFHQVEGLVIEKGINFCNLVSCITDFFKVFFEANDLKIRIRPSYFPFTEPSAEVDLSYGIKNGKITIGSGDKFLETMGCGMVHPDVLRNGKVDPDIYSGFAFGFGVERLASLKYGIPDLRGYFEISKDWKDTFGMSPFL